jgi:outer membrane protein TolC
MQTTHQPRDQFVERLAGEIRAEVRRRNRAAQGPGWTRWLPQSPIKVAVAIAAIVVVSMAAGGFVVAAAYQAQTNEQRQILKANYANRVALAQQRLAIAAEALKEAQQRVSVGTGDQDAVLEARFKVIEAEAQLKLINLQLAEVEATGSEPLNAVTSPLVSGRDFVIERWQVEMSIPEAALEVEKTRLQSAQRRVAAGVASPMEVQASRTRMLEMEAAIGAMQKKVGIRQRLLKREMDAALADLRVLEVEAEQRRQTLEPRIDLARQTVKDLEAKFQTGSTDRVELMRSQLQLLEIELEIAKVNVDLANIQRQIAQKVKKD